MNKVVLYMSMSFDGMISGHDDGPGRGLGVNGEALHAWLSDGGISPGSHRPGVGVNAEVFDEMMQTGAVITGRRTFELAGGWGGDHHDGVPVFVLTRQLPDQPAPGHARYVTELESAVAQAKEAAGDRNVLLHGGSAARALLDAGLVDELVIHLVPIILGRGRRLFDDQGHRARNLELVSATEGADVLHLRYRVVSR
ncbi:dihydrofolate reductase family protein [Microlunatus parietis]|uniref:Dihydrofolate reductase n=1 Tax=Microlunatus parietis TaxID=682979 RepID=A0A7Y9LBP5_9ACTN|nr:dihydrofolate reductase family protein [Microlunatus parietis]NYE70036.1 dihydrofolate reductase [Microlunatus parietis]